MTEMVVARHGAECLAMAGHEADRLASLSEYTQRSVAEPRWVGDVFHQHLSVPGLQHSGIVRAHADVARKSRLLIEIDGAERQQRLVVRCDLDHVPCCGR